MPVLWTKSTLLGLLVAEAGLERIPAQPWTLEAAIEKLARSTKPESGLGGAARSWLLEQAGPGGRVGGVEAWLADAAQAGLLRPEGEGWQAGYSPRADWIRQSAALGSSLSGEEREGLAAGAQCLVAMSTMLWKKPAA